MIFENKKHYLLSLRGIVTFKSLFFSAKTFESYYKPSAKPSGGSYPVVGLKIIPLTFAKL